MNVQWRIERIPKLYFRKMTVDTNEVQPEPERNPTAARPLQF